MPNLQTVEMAKCMLQKPNHVNLKFLVLPSISSHKKKGQHRCVDITGFSGERCSLSLSISLSLCMALSLSRFLRNSAHSGPPSITNASASGKAAANSGVLNELLLQILFGFSLLIQFVPLFYFYFYFYFYVYLYTCLLRLLLLRPLPPPITTAPTATTEMLLLLLLLLPLLVRHDDSDNDES